MWLRYARYLEGRGKVAGARAVLARAGTTLKGHLPLLLAHARFEEAHGAHAAAAELCAQAPRTLPQALPLALTLALPLSLTLSAPRRRRCVPRRSKRRSRSCSRLGLGLRVRVR